MAPLTCASVLKGVSNGCQRGVKGVSKKCYWGDKGIEEDRLEFNFSRECGLFDKVKHRVEHDLFHLIRH